MRILGYRGKSITSRLIQAQTRSEHSHIGVQISGGRVIEAWQGTGVRLIPDPFHGHSKGTEIDVYRPATYRDGSLCYGFHQTFL